MTLSVSDAIESLRAELEKAQQQSLNKNLQFNVGSIELELEIMVEQQTGADTKVNWWVLTGGMSGHEKNADKHKLKITLQPVNASGQPIKVANQVEERPK